MHKLSSDDAAAFSAAHIASAAAAAATDAVTAAAVAAVSVAGVAGLDLPRYVHLSFLHLPPHEVIQQQKGVWASNWEASHPKRVANQARLIANIPIPPSRMFKAPDRDPGKTKTHI